MNSTEAKAPRPSRAASSVGRRCFTVLRCAVLLSVLATARVDAREFYVDQLAGSDSNVGIGPAAAFRSLERLSKVTLEPGDIVRLKRGCTFRSPLAFAGNGTQEQPIRITTYGNGPKPEILGSLELKEWQLHQGLIHKHALPRAADSPRGTPLVVNLFEYDDGKVPRRLIQGGAMPTERGHFYADAATNTLFIMTSDGKAASTHRYEVSTGGCTIFTDRSWIELDGLAFLFNRGSLLRVLGSHDVTIRNCAVLFQALAGGPTVFVGANSTRVQFLRCFVYDGNSNLIRFTNGPHHCRVAGCTIVKCQANDCVTFHSGEKIDGKPTGLCGDYNIVEDCVIGLANENAIDITSGDHHIARRNICYNDFGSANIVIGHGADHVQIEDNICFGCQRRGIQVHGNPAEGARGANQIIGNLVYNTQYSGMSIDTPDTLVAGNTVLNAKMRPTVVLGVNTVGVSFQNNIIGDLSDSDRVPLLGFDRGIKLDKLRISNNLFYHAGRKDGRVISTDDELTPAMFDEQFSCGESNQLGDPQFNPDEPEYYTLTKDSPAIAVGDAMVVQSSNGVQRTFKDFGWQPYTNRKDRPMIPEVLITGKDKASDDRAILTLWGKQSAGISSARSAATSATVQQKIVGEITYAVRLTFEDDFEDLNDWVVESTGTVQTRDGQLVWDCSSVNGGLGTIWCREHFSGPTIVEYDVVAVAGQNNLNFMAYATHPDGLLETTKLRTGKYKEYHQFPNYIVTYLCSDAVPNAQPKGTLSSTWRVRFRRNPGFNLLTETLVSRSAPAPQKQQLTYVFDADGKFSLFVDGKLVQRFQDSQTPLRDGYHGFRTWKSTVRYSNFRVYDIQ